MVGDDEPSTSDYKPASLYPNQADLYEEKVEPSENDFDLEPAEPIEFTEPTIETTESIAEPIALESENSEETNEAMHTMPCDD